MRPPCPQHGIHRSECRVVVYFLVTLAVAASVVTGLDSIEFQKTLPAKVVWGVVGKDVELPCDVTPPIPSDSVTMVFWFKDGTGVPLYSLDARKYPLEKASHLALSDSIGTRSYFIMDDEPSKARLKIQNVSRDDEGAFRCRVDFVNSPTRNFKVNLTLVVQPSAPRVFDAEGREVISTAGPFLEGKELFLSCQVTGGRPDPSLTWWFNDTLIDGVVDSRKGMYTVNQLVIPSLQRSFFGGRFECRTSALSIAGYIIKDVQIIVYLKPHKVKIVTPNELLSVRKPQLHRCETTGSYPPARIIWMLGGKPVTNAVVTEEEEKHFSSSIISLNVEPGDDGKDLVCRAENPRFPGGHAEDRRQIHVAYPPKATVELDMGTLPVKEGSMVRLRCKYEARPSPHSFAWYHDGHLIPYNESGGVLPMDNLLLLKNVSRSFEGQYSCAATNTEGESYSESLALDIQYAPRCKKGYEITQLAAPPLDSFETVEAHCYVDAVPPVTRFHWTYNTSRGVNPVKGARMQNKEDTSVLHFSPGAADVESLSCWATNDVGRQGTPCLFYIVPANKPESPRNCHLQNSSFGVLEVVCLAGHDGGLEQRFVLEVIDIPLTRPSVTTLSDEPEHRQPVFTTQSNKPQFRLPILEPGKEYQALVYAENAKGRSEPPIVLSHIKLETPERPPEENDYGGLEADLKTASNPILPPGRDLTLLLIGIAAAAVLLIIGIVSVAGILACRRQPTVVLRRPRQTNKPPDELSEAGFGEGFLRRSAQYRASLYGQELEERTASVRHVTGPDLILAPVSLSPQDTEY